MHIYLKVDLRKKKPLTLREEKNLDFNTNFDEEQKLCIQAGDLQKKDLGSTLT